MEPSKDYDFYELSNEEDKLDPMFEANLFEGCNYTEEFITSKRQDPTEIIAKKIKAERLNDDFKLGFSLREEMQDIKYDFTESTLNQDGCPVFIINPEKVNSSESEISSKIRSSEASEAHISNIMNPKMDEKAKRKPISRQPSQEVPMEITKFDKGERFSKKNDADIFKILRKLCQRRGISIENFWKDDLPLPKPEVSVLLELSICIGWKRNRKMDLLKRIRRTGRRKNFTVRETKFLMRLMKKEKHKETPDYEAVLENFPGKTLEGLIKTYNEAKENIPPSQQVLNGVSNNK
ncbi:unnamed protein product [Moneuplotes crassus]|uniref:Uncharacterized protein n=1 Tax=Euplotes crassus TaxID=5936 RepID=A0AAD1Y1W0_EUPCR|nr:unnamed protein product [Moneuplotes crassus]